MNETEAYEIFEQWYDDCLENGIDPNVIIERMGGLYLIANEELINRLKDNGDI
jgi:hypothetical protein